MKHQFHKLSRRDNTLLTAGLNPRIYPLLFALVLTFIACSDQLATEPNGKISGEQLNDNSLESLSLGMYYTTFQQGTGGTTRQDDFGQKAVDISLDLMSSDMGSTSTMFFFFMGTYRFDFQVRTGIINDMIWQYYYKIVKKANGILDLLDGDENIPTDATQKAYWGQAKAMRAYAYFYLANLYQHPYDEAKDKLCVPLYRTQTNAEPQAQSTVKEIYDLIINDLEDAVAALDGYERGANKIKIDKNVALGLLAYARLSRGETGDYQKAADAAAEVIASGKSRILTANETLTNGFNSVTSPNWMWGVDVTTSTTEGLSTWWSNVDYYANGYCYQGNIKVIDDEFYASIPATDIRKNQFGNATTKQIGETPLQPFNKFFDAKRAPGGDGVFTNDLVYMRIEEMYLIQAEALARLGNNPASLLSLNSLLSLRDPSANLEDLSAAELLDQIWFNWRAELWGEGKTYFAMKRFKKTIHRSNNHVYFPNRDFAYNYERMIFEIPEYEWVNNPKLK
jgi:hypothetical protein